MTDEPNVVICPYCGSDNVGELNVDRDDDIVEYICYYCHDDFEIEEINE